MVQSSASSLCKVVVEFLVEYTYYQIFCSEFLFSYGDVDKNGQLHSVAMADEDIVAFTVDQESSVLCMGNSSSQSLEARVLDGNIMRQIVSQFANIYSLR